MTDTAPQQEENVDEEPELQERIPGEQLYAFRITATAEVIRADGTKE